LSYARLNIADEIISSVTESQRTIQY